MSLIFFDSFETTSTYPKSSPGCQWILQGTSSTSSRFGNYALGLSSSNNLAIPAAAKVTVGFAYNLSSFATTAVPISLWGDGGTTQHLTLTIETTGVINLRRGTASGTIIATGSASWPGLSQWRSIQIQATIADAGGTCIVKLDNATIINFTGDTKNGGTNTTIDRISPNVGGSSAPLLDDLWICDGVDATATQGAPNNDFLGDIGVFPLHPNGNGNYSQLAGSDGNSTDNYLLVDESPPNTTDYVASATSGQHDTYTLQDLPSAAQSVIAVQPVVIASKSDTGAASIKTMLRETGGTNTTDTAAALSTSWAAYSGAIRGVKPSDGTLWAVSDVNALEAGAEVA
jgi:hypothetical protein